MHLLVHMGRRILAESERVECGQLGVYIQVTAHGMVHTGWNMCRSCDAGLCMRPGLWGSTVMYAASTMVLHAAWVVWGMHVV